MPLADAPPSRPRTTSRLASESEGALDSELEVRRRLCSAKCDLPQDVSSKVIRSDLASAGRPRERAMSTAASFSKKP